MGSKAKGNRFDGLSPETPLSNPPAKKQRTITLEDFPILPTKTIAKNPKFVVITQTNDKKPISSVSVFVLKKAIDAVSTEYENVTQLRDGSILILAKNIKIAEKFMKITNIANICPVQVKYHDHLNASKGLVYAPCLKNIPETEIVAEMRSQNVTEVYKFNKKVEDKFIPSGLMLFTFDLYQPPTTVEIGWYKAKVNEYIPNPMRCRNCQLLGHTKKRCDKQQICETCNLPSHMSEICTRTMCANCQEPHPSSSLNCPKYKQNKEILTIKTRNKCTMAEAKRTYYQLNPSNSQSNGNAYSQKLRQTNSINSLNPSTQTIKPAEPIGTQKQPTSVSSSSSISEQNLTPIIEKQTPPPQSSKPLLANSNPKSNDTISQAIGTQKQLTSTPSSSSILEKKSIPISDKQTPPKTFLANNNSKPNNSIPSITLQNQNPQNSPLSSLTNNLIQNNSYFMNISDDEQA